VAPELPDRQELLELLAERARDGNVQAIRLLLEEERRDDGSSDGSALDRLDELAPRRRKRAS
jgi:hypothetical protein